MTTASTAGVSANRKVERNEFTLHRVSLGKAHDRALVCTQIDAATHRFAISSEREGVIHYSRCNFSGRARGVIHCFDLMYPQEEKRSWDAVVTRISLSLRPLES